jgi:hypothetical protein
MVDSQQSKDVDLLVKNIETINSSIIQAINFIHSTSYEPKIIYDAFLNTSKIYIWDSTHAIDSEHFKDYEFVFNAILNNIKVENNPDPKINSAIYLKRSDIKLGTSNFFTIEKLDKAILSGCDNNKVLKISTKVLRDFDEKLKSIAGNKDYSLELNNSEIKKISLRLEEIRNASIDKRSAVNDYISEDVGYDADDEDEDCEKVPQNSSLANPQAQKVKQQTHSQAQVLQ